MEVVQWFFLLQVVVTIGILLTEKFDRTLVVLTSTVFSVGFIRFLEDKNPNIIYEELINWHTIALIIGMTLFVENLKEVNFFDYWSIKVVLWSRLDAMRLFVFLGIFTLLLSSFLDNVSAIILLASLSIVLAERLELDPVPIILYQGFLTGVGGLVTPVGSVPTIIINGEAEIPFFVFMGQMAIISIVCFVLTTLYFIYRYRPQLEKLIDDDVKNAFLVMDPRSVLTDSSVILKGNIMLGVLMVGFIFSETIGLGVDFIALGAGIISMIVFNVKSRKVWGHVNWDMIFFFIGLFIIIGGLEQSGALDGVVELLDKLITQQPILALLIILVIGGIASAFLDSIPVALLFASMLASINIGGNELSDTFWLATVFATNIGGGLAPIGSVTVLMAIETLHEKNHEIRFLEYVKLILPLFLLLSLLGWIYFVALEWFFL